MQPGPGKDVLNLDPRIIADSHRFYKMARIDFVGGSIDKIWDKR